MLSFCATGYSQTENSEFLSEENEIGFGFSADLNSRYLNRGFEYSEDFVLQPCVWSSFRSFSFSIWSNLNLRNSEGYNTFNECDYTLSYNFTHHNISIEPAIQLYTYPGSEESLTGETSLKISYARGDFNFFASQFVDVARYKGAYFAETGVSFERRLEENIYITGSMSLGFSNSKFNNTYSGIPVNAVHNFYSSASLTFYPYENLYFRGKFEMSALINGRLRACNCRQPVLNFGISLGMEI